MHAKTIVVGVLGLVLGAGGAVVTRDRWSAYAASAPASAGDDCKGCKTKAPSTGVVCPARYLDDTLVITDAADLERVRTSLVDGVFSQWLDLGRAPTPSEIGARLKLDEKATDALMDKLAACGQSAEIGIRRVPDSELIAVAWPFANVPTGIDVTVEGKKTVHARCAIDALGVSKMVGKKAVVVARSHDGADLTVEVDGDRIVATTPQAAQREAVVWKGGSCDTMMFFSSKAALGEWQKTHPGEGRAFTLEDAVKDGAEIFGRFARPFGG